KLNTQITAIDAKFENSKDSLYGWLNDNVPNWEHTIGKVIDEQKVSFQKRLNAKKITNNKSNFYRIQIDTNEIDKNVKTVADLQNEQANYQNKIQNIHHNIQQLKAELNDNLDKLKRRFHPKIKEQKELVQQNEYNKESGKSKLDELMVRLSEWETKAKTEKQLAIENIENNIAKLNEEKAKAEEQVLKIETSINKTIDVKKKEKIAKVKEKQQNLNDALQKLDTQIRAEKENIHKKSETIKSAQKQELNTKGADTQRIDEIDLRLSEISSELNFINANLSITERYKYDKEQLFDKESEFKNSKSL